ncbi:hypothetical protein [Bradyrhizobium sp. 30]|uniref:hypothetical protein n=1 Tax=Bradyrhizobium sp. 30 TaxID=2782669 RepID=UPI001FF9B15C|nr:hypothetical protein [Bradyrhizobium sp. 30]MCK1295194.1 hypothetical protein [Bradyrhizobium sp. 30]
MLGVTERPVRILAAVNFHFRESRLQYLFQVIRALCEYPVEALDIVITTNVDRDGALKEITDLCGPLFRPFPARSKSTKGLSIESFPKLATPWLLPWSHKHLISERFLSAESTCTHFIYVEDDILLSFDNFCYFTRYREMLKGRRLIPSFQRIEYNDADNHLYLVDQVGVSDLSSRNRVDLDGYAFINLDYPFNAMFILDRELALEYVETPSFDRERSKLVRPDWDVACRAAMGLCFENPPEGFAARYVSPVDPGALTTPSWSWVYHLPNNYAKDRLKPFAKTRTDQQFSSEGNVVGWRPASKVVEYLALMRGKKRSSGPEPSL